MIVLTAGRDGGLKSLEVFGMLAIRIADEAFGRIKLAMQVKIYKWCRSLSYKTLCTHIIFLLNTNLLGSLSSN